MEELFKRVQCKDEPEWLEQRQYGIGGSSCASILGLNPYMTITELWSIKTGKTKRKNQNNFCIDYGKKTEDVIRELFKIDYEKLLKVEHRDFELLIRKDKPFIRASLDGELLVLQDCTICGVHLKKGMRGILEIKTCESMKRETLDQWNDDNIPYNYHCQRLHYLITTGYDFHILIVDFRKTLTKEDYWEHKTKTYCVLAKDMQNQLSLLEDKETYFWTENVEKKIRPTLEFEIKEK